LQAITTNFEDHIVPSEDLKMGALRQKALALADAHEEEIGKVLSASFRGVSGRGVSGRGVSGDPNDWLTEEEIVAIMTAMSATANRSISE
jgi:hypothetical protein